MKDINKICYDAQDKRIFAKLPKYAQEVADYFDTSKTRDGWHLTLGFTDENGEHDAIDEYGMGDFMGLVKMNKRKFINIANRTEEFIETIHT